MDIGTLSDQQLKKLIDSRWDSASSVWDTISQVYDLNTTYYDCDPKRLPNHLLRVSAKSHRVRSNRIFRDSESTINALIANPPKPNVLPGRETDEAKGLARTQERYLVQRYEDLNVEGELRSALRFLYFSRLLVLKPFWDPKLNDFNVRSVDPRKVRFSPKATKEEDSDFAIEQIECSLTGLIAKYPSKKAEILKTSGNDETQAFIEGKQVTYKEAWIGDWKIVKYGSLILERKRNPYWDWDGIRLNDSEAFMLANTKENPPDTLFRVAEESQEERMAIDESDMEDLGLQQYLFNHFDRPRKPYIFATILNDERKPIGRTSLIEQAIPLQEAVDRRKRQIDDNARMVNGITKVDSSVMSQDEARKLKYDAEGLIWGKGVVAGVQRETGSPLPNFVYEDMVDSRNEIDNIMAASSAFRGEREGTETKAGRLALIDQSYQNLTELVKVVDYVSRELFNWFYHMAKLNYTETHYAKSIGPSGATETMELMRNDFIDGTEVRVIPGKTLPEDRKFKFERAQNDKDVLSMTDYLTEEGYDDPKGMAARAMAFKADPFSATGVIPPPPPPINETPIGPTEPIAKR